jgi:hypothetical protein
VAGPAGKTAVRSTYATAKAAAGKRGAEPRRAVELRNEVTQHHLLLPPITLHTAGMTNKTIVDPDRLHEQAQNAALAGLLRGDDVDALLAAIAPHDLPGTFTPDVAVLELAVDALDLAHSPGSDPLEYEGLRERYLPEVEFYGAPSTATASTPSR